MSCPNGVEPLQLPIHNVTVTSSGRAVSRGVEFGIGTPQQIVALQLALLDSEVFIPNLESCNGTASVCAGELGGMYDATLSDTYSQVTKSQWNGTDSRGTDEGFIFFNDRVQYGSNSSHDAFPLLMSQPSFSHQGGLPLGPNSTFLTQAYESGQSSSTAVGLYPGRRNIENPEDGLLILGGYDRSRVDGELVELDYNLECPTCVEVKSIVYETPDGSESLIDEPLTVLLEMYARDIGVPQSTYDRFIRTVGATYNPDLFFAVVPPDVPLGELTVTLANDYTITVPAEELFTKPRHYNDEGVYEISDHDTTFAMVSNLTDPTIPPIWGLTFLSQNYLVIDHARQQWKIGKAIKVDNEDIFDFGPEPDIEAICDPNDNGNGSGTNTGAIAGGVIGGVAFLGLIAFGIWFYLRRKKRNAAGGSGDGRTAAKMEEQLPPSYQQHDAAAAKEMGDKSNMLATNGPVELFSPVSPQTAGHDSRISELASPAQMQGKDHRGVGGFAGYEQVPQELDSAVASSVGKKGRDSEAVELP